MPPPSSENDLKRLARRRLIGAVALTLLAVIVLPQLLEDEPPPASSLAVHMAAVPQPVLDQAAQPDPADAPDVAAAPVPPPPPPQPAPQVEPAKPAPIPEPIKAAPVKPVYAPPAKPASTPAPQLRSTALSEAFVVQLAALSDSAKAQALKARATEAGLPAYMDKAGALTRVRVGPYASREAAVAAAVKLAENGMSGQVLAK